MPTWRRTINLVALWARAHTRKITARQTALELDQAIQRTIPADEYDDDLEAIRELLQALPETATFADFDEVLRALYDWADAHRVWLATF